MKVIKPLNFSNFEFERASSATYFNSTGVMSSAAEDVLRETYDPDTLDYIGPLFENEATNYVPFSNDFVTWTPQNASSEIAASGLIQNPDTSTPAQSMDLDGSEAWGVTLGLGVIDGPKCFSVFVKPKELGSGGLSSLTLTLSGGSGYAIFARFNTNFTTPSVVYSGGPITTHIQKINNGWLRISISGALPSSALPYFIRIYGDDISLAGSDGDGLHYLWGAQVEDGMNPSSFIYTEGSPETRAPDIQVSNPPSVVSNNVAEDEAPTWDVSTPYLAEDLVQVLGTYHRLYSAVVDNTGEFPPENTPAIWIDKGNTNPWRMFDMTTGAEMQTVATAEDNSIQVVLAVQGGVDAVVLLNVEGGRATIVVRDSGGEIVAEYEQSLLGEPSDTGWWDFWFGERTSTDMVIFTDFNLVTQGTITVTVEGGDAPAKLGKLIVGEAFEIGCAKFGTSAGIIDFSRKERDSFGNNVIVERRYIDKCEYDILIDTDSAYDIKRFLASIRATPAVYIGSEKHLVTVVFGFFRDFSIILQGPKKSACSLQAEGI